MIPCHKNFLEHFFQKKSEEVKKFVSKSSYLDISDKNCYECKKKVHLNSESKNCFLPVPRVVLRKEWNKFHFICQDCVAKFSENDVIYLSTWKGFQQDMKLGIIQELINERNKKSS